MCKAAIILVVQLTEGTDYDIITVKDRMRKRLHHKGSSWSAKSQPLFFQAWQVWLEHL